MHLDQWTPSSVIRDGDGFRVRDEGVYRGSWFISRVQLNAYVPVFRRYLRGHLLDAGCGKAPYLEVYQDQITQLTTLDHPGAAGSYAQVRHDLNTPLPFADASFDSTLLADVLGHVYEQRALIRECARVLRPGGHLVITTPFVYWISMHPHEYFHPTDSALRRMAEEAGLHVAHLEAYGGYPEVLMDTLNKGMTGRWSFRLLRLFIPLLKKLRWMKRERARNGSSFPAGYVLVASKPE